MLNFSKKFLIVCFAVALSIPVFSDDVVFSKEQVEAAGAECKASLDEIRASGGTINININRCARACLSSYRGEASGRYCAKEYKAAFGHYLPDINAAAVADAKPKEVNTSKPVVSNYKISADVIASFEAYKNECAPYVGAKQPGFSEPTNDCVRFCRTPTGERESTVKVIHHRCRSAHISFQRTFETRAFPKLEEHFYDVSAKLEVLTSGADKSKEQTHISFKVIESSNAAFSKRCPVVIYHSHLHRSPSLSPWFKKAIGDVTQLQLKRVAPINDQKAYEILPDCIVIDAEQG